jgi:hypothetical protein
MGVSLEAEMETKNAQADNPASDFIRVVGWVLRFFSMSACHWEAKSPDDLD